MRKLSRRVLRLEHCQTSLGPYQNIPSANAEWKEMFWKHSEDFLNHPCLKKDKLVRATIGLPTLEYLIDEMEVDSAWHFGFNSMTQLRNWFTDDELKLLHSNGFNLVVYQSSNDDCLSFKKQVVFNKRNATIEFKQNLISLVRN